VTAPASSTPPPPAPAPAAPKIESETRRTPGGASIVGVDKLIEGRTESFKDLFHNTPGVFVDDTNGGENVKISIRGSGIQSDDVLGIEFLLDGLPYNEGDGEALLEDFDLQSIKGAEVYRGSNALRYGATTLGGAINLLARTGYDADRIAGRFEMGSFGYYQTALSSGAVIGPTDYFVAIKDIQSEGYRSHSAENNQKLFFDIGEKIDENTDNRFYFSMGHLDRNEPGSLTKAQLLSNPKQPGDDALDQNFNLTWENLRLADKATLKCGDATFSYGAHYQFRILRDREDYDPDDPDGILRFHSNDFGQMFNYDSKVDLFGHKSRLTLGLSPTFEFEADANYQNLSGRQGPQINGDFTTAANVPLYGQEQFYLNDKFSIIGGMQVAFILRKFVDTYNAAAVPNQSHTQDYLGLNPKIGCMYEFSDEIQAFGNFSRSFQPPSFDDLAAVQNSLGVLYRTLQAQTGSTVEIGTRGETGRVTWDVALYRTWLRDELLALKNAKGLSIGTINADSTTHQGIEMGVEADLFRGMAVGCPCKNDDLDELSLHTTYTLNDFRFSDDHNFGNNRIAGIPVQLLNAELEYKHPNGFYASFGTECNLSKYPVDHANTLYADAYELLNFKAGYKSCHGYSIFFQVKNLTNKIYASTIEAQADARQGGAPDAFNPGNGRAFYGGISFKW